MFRVAIHADSCNRAKPERLEYLNDVYRLYRCRGIMNCTEVCPMGLNPWQAIERIREEQRKESL